ncbi:MAG: hypothetical protein ACP5HU_12130 [Phycisphaerae bacterium]
MQAAGSAVVITMFEEQMGTHHSPETCRMLESAFRDARLERAMRPSPYEPGDKLTYEVRGLLPANSAKVRLRVEKFVGGGYAGQVYRVRPLKISPEGAIPGLETGRVCGLKILVPPSSFARRFRDILYAVGFQGAFRQQVHPDAARAGALWQKFVRRAAKVRFGDESCVSDIYATLVDRHIGGCGELREWVEGRPWRFEVDDRLLARMRWKVGEDDTGLGSPEYRAKKAFMYRLVKLMHEMGAPELARQYEWWTCKSQPNVMKRTETEHDPSALPTAVDFRAGLTLLPFLPMSPADVKLIVQGIGRGSLVQFDRGQMHKLERFVAEHANAFADMSDALEELKRTDRAYRESLPDITHHHVRLLVRPKLWSRIRQGAITGWNTRNVADDACTNRLRGSWLLSCLFAMLCWLRPIAPVAAVALLVAAWAGGWLSGGVWAVAAGLGLVLPPMAGFIRRIWGRGDYRRHYLRILTSLGYFRRALRGRMAEKISSWHRDGRVGEAKAQRLLNSPLRFTAHAVLSVLPSKLHRLLTDWSYVGHVARQIFVRPVRLYFNADAREQWLRQMLRDGRKNGMLSDEDADRIEARIKEPFIQKYLKSLAVHVCTLPVTQVVALIVAAVIIYLRPELTIQEALAVAGGTLVAFQVVPISPGSLVRGLYVVYLVIRERNFRDYNIAVFLSFFKYVGYLGFPIQMTYRYPALARFMAGHWATGAVHVVPVFGERGGLLEHAVFDLFYNLPLTIRRRMRLRAERRKSMPARAWHVLPVALMAAGALAAVDLAFQRWGGGIPSLKQVWWAVVWMPFLVGILVVRLAGGATTGARMVMAVLTGAALGLVYGVFNRTMLHLVFPPGGEALTTAQIAVDMAEAAGWGAFLFALLATVGGLLSELFVGEQTPLASVAPAQDVGKHE